MKAGEVLRVESKVFTQGEMPWFQKITACVAMDLNAELGPDTQAPVFSSGVLEKASASGTSLTLKWPAAADDQTAANGIKYTVFVGKEAITADSLPTEGGVTVTGETTAILGDLTAATDYYAAVVAEDAAGNKSVLSGGPFATLGETEEPDPDDPDDPVIADPTAPLTPNMDANSAGIISSATGRVQIGWNAAPASATTAPTCSPKPTLAIRWIKRAIPCPIRRRNTPSKTWKAKTMKSRLSATTCRETPCRCTRLSR